MTPLEQLALACREAAEALEQLGTSREAACAETVPGYARPWAALVRLVAEDRAVVVEALGELYRASQAAAEAVPADVERLLHLVPAGVESAGEDHAVAEALRGRARELAEALAERPTVLKMAAGGARR